MGAFLATYGLRRPARTRSRLRWVVVILVLAFAGGHNRLCPEAEEGREMVLYVAPNGNDGWSGRPAEPNDAETDGPKATLRAALEAAGRLGVEQPRRIVLRGGDYFVEETVVLVASDSGLVIEAAPGEQATLYGGRRLTGWKPDGERLWAAELPEVAEGEWDFRMLVVNGRFCRRARLPKEARFTHLSEFPVPWMGTTGGGWQRKPTEQELTTLKYRPEDLGPWLDIKNAEVAVYHMWDESVVGIASVDHETQTVTFSSALGHPPGGFGVKDYVVWNVREGLHEPGQWYLDRTAGKVVYRPMPGEDMNTAAAVAPTTETIIRISGSEAEPVRDVTLRGLRLSVTDTPLRAGGFGAGRFEGAVSMVYTEGCRLEGLEILNVNGQGIRTWKCAGLRVDRCHVHHTGAGGMMVRGKGAVAADNHIHDVGLAYPSAIGLWGGGDGYVVEHNEVHDTTYSAMICGGSDGRVESNLIYNAMTVLHDGAGIYSGGAKGLVMRGNFIRDIVDTGGYGASAYYLDEMCENCVVEGNLSLRVVRPSHNHWAGPNTVRGNVFVCDADMNVTFPRCKDYTFERNVMWARGKITFRNAAAVTSMPGNVLFSGADEVVAVGLKDYAEGERVPLEPTGGTVLADPLLDAGDLERGVCRFAPDSPVHGLGLKTLDVSDAGPRSE